jgi:hypothetical protein
MKDETIEERVRAEQAGDYRKPVIDFLLAWPLRPWVLDLVSTEAGGDGEDEHFSPGEAETLYDLIADYYPRTLEQVEERWKRSLP